MEDFKFALLYFVSDRTVAIYSLKDVIGWDQNELERLRNKEKIILTADYELKSEKV